jgi:hypothetical protein
MLLDDVDRLIQAVKKLRRQNSILFILILTMMVIVSTITYYLIDIISQLSWKVHVLEMIVGYTDI